MATLQPNEKLKKMKSKSPKSSVRLLASKFGSTVKAKKIKVKKKSDEDSESEPEFANKNLRHVVCIKINTSTHSFNPIQHKNANANPKAKYK